MMVNKAIVVRGRLLIKARRAVTMYRVKGDRIQTAQVTPGSAAQAKGGWSTTKPKPAGAKKKKRTRRKRAPRVEPPDRRERSAKPPTPDAPQDLAEVYAPPNWVGRVDDLGKLTLGGAREDGSRLSSDLAQTVIREALESAGVRFPNYGVSYSDPKFKSTRDVVTDGVTFRAVAESLVSALERFVDHVGQHAPEPLDWSGSRRGRHYNESAGIAAAMTSYPGWEAFTTRPHEVLSGAKRWDPALHEQEVSRR